MPVTLREIASQLNLSAGLVSKVLNDRPGVWASQETQARIRRAARELNYHPHAAARALRSGKTCVVALVILRSSSPHQRWDYGAAFEGLAEGLGDMGYRLLTLVQPDQEAVLACLRELVHTRSCDAVVLWGPEALVEAQGELLEEAEMPFVTNGRHEERHPHWPQVDFDHERLMSQVVGHFIALGRRRIAYVGFNTGGIFRGRLCAGFLGAMERAGLPVPAAFRVELPGDDLEAVERQMDDWLSLPAGEQPDAVAVGANNATWQGIELALLRRGRRIGEAPGEFAVAGQSFFHHVLMFGQGLAYRELETHYLSDAAVASLLRPLLTGREPERRIVRLSPELRPLPSLRLQERIPIS